MCFDNNYNVSDHAVQLIVGYCTYAPDPLPVESNTRTAMAVAFLATPYVWPIMVPMYIQYYNNCYKVYTGK